MDAYGTATLGAGAGRVNGRSRPQAGGCHALDADRRRRHPAAMSTTPRHWIVTSETGRLADVLVCAPDHYRWVPTNAIARRTLAAGGQADLQALQSQHGELVQALRQGGARVHHLPPEAHLPYMAYTRDQVVVTHRGPVLCQLERPQRRGEYAALIDWHQGTILAEILGRDAGGR